VDLDDGVRINGIVTGLELANNFPDDLIGKQVQISFIELEGRVILGFRLNE
jgi:hypothetical protein